MMASRRIAILAGIGLALATFLAPARATTDEIPEADGPLIQMAILLDTSNSMDGLIHQAKAQLWKIVNEFLYAKKGDQVPRLQIALYEYGKSTLPAEEGHLRAVTPLTDDLDRVSQELFALTTNGGQEYAGHVIRQALLEMPWSDDPNDLKTIFIAGNEGFDQGTVPFRESCRAAIARGIVVNTIFCGDRQKGVQTFWEEGARLSDGSYMHIDQNQALANIEAPQDAEIQKLGTALNETYIPFGDLGLANSIRQTEQDKNSLEVGNASNVQRMACKASFNYCNSSWDLVDAIDRSNVKLEDVKVEELPEAMQKMTADERRKHVESMSTSRKKIQKQIQLLNTARNTYIANERRKLADDSTDTLDEAMGECLRGMANQKRFELAPKPEARPDGSAKTEGDTKADAKGIAPEAEPVKKAKDDKGC